MHKDADKVNIVSGLKIKWGGTIDVGDFYSKLKLWLYNQGYGDEMKNFKEAKYLQRMKADGKEIDFRWVCEKKVNDYFANMITITISITRMKDAEANVNGRKVKSNSANFDIKLSADLIKNAKGKWGKDSFMKKMYETFIIKERIENNKMALYQKVYGLHDEIKTFFDMQKY